MYFLLRAKARLLQTVLFMGTAYIALCLFAVVALLPRDSAQDSPENYPLDVRAQQGEVLRHSLSKRGGRPRNIIFSSEGREDELAHHPEARHQPDPSLNRSKPLNSTPASSSNSSGGVATLENNFRPTELSDVFIGVKTTEKYHDLRLPVLFETWLDSESVKKQTYFFTDADNSKYNTKMNGHFINTHCANRHSRQDLCCKMGVIFSAYLKSQKRWWCNVDDDNYININNLLTLLRSYRHDKDYYLGRSSTSAEIVVNDNGDKRNLSKEAIFQLKQQTRRKTSFWFATGGAGVCISWSLALKMSPYAGFGEFMQVCNRINLPDDVSIGFLVVDLLGVRLTKISDMHSHLIVLKNLKEENIKKAITVSYRIKSPTETNCIKLKDAAFNTTADPTRLKSLHCKLHPNAPICPRV